MQIVDCDDREWNPESDRVRVLVPRPQTVIPNHEPRRPEVCDLPNAGIAPPHPRTSRDDDDAIIPFITEW